MIKTGVADMIANFMISILFPFGKVAVLFGIYFITSILAAYITNKAAVAIIWLQGLRVIQFPQPFQPVELGHLDLPGTAVGIAVLGEVASYNFV